MSPMHKSITALAASALLATVGFATAQSTDSTTTTTTTDPAAAMPANNPQTTTTTDANGNQTTTTTTVDTATEVIPAQPTGVVELAKPKDTVMPTDKQPNGPLGMQNNLMTTGVVDGITRPSVGDHATPPIPGPDTQVSVTRETTTSTTVTPPVAVTEPAPAPEPAAAPAPAPEPVLAPKADRN
ncbi:MAG: hypothetical protein ACJ8IK_19245 [Burkholderiaceae bacterium]|jgi:hypothetical protein